MKEAAALLFGLVFGFGLIISGMINPEKVQNFLDVAGDWDPSLAFVMAGAIGVARLPFWKRALKLELAEPAKPASSQRIDVLLVLGSSLFGLGWGLAGYCPGPAITSLGVTFETVSLFVAAMVAGTLAVSLVSKR